MKFEMQFDDNDDVVYDPLVDAEVIVGYATWIAKRIERGETNGHIRDDNGNTIGSWSF